MVNLEELILWEEDRMYEKVMDIENNHEKDNGEQSDDDDIKIWGAPFWGLKQVQVEWIYWIGIIILTWVVQLLYLILYLSS